MIDIPNSTPEDSSNDTEASQDLIETSVETEPILSREQLVELVQPNPALVNLVMDHYKLPEPYKKPGHNPAFDVISTEHFGPGRAASFEQGYRIDYAISSEYTARHVSEVITVVEHTIDGTYSVVNPNSEKAHEPIVLIDYQTLTNNERNRYYPYFGGGRPGNQFHYQLFLPESDARILVKAIESQPEIARTLGDVIMRDRFGADTAWEEVRPPYEQWAQVNGGINRIALRDGSQTPDNSQILEF